MKRDWAKNELLRRIHDGEYTPSEQLPSEKQLAKDLAVSHQTVRAGLKELVSAGIVEKRPRVGNFLKPIHNRLLTRTVTLLLPSYMTGQEHQHPAVGLMLRGVQSVLPQDDYEITFMVYEQTDLTDAINLLVGRGVHGVLFWPTNKNSREQVDRLLDCDFPVVILNGDDLWPDLAAPMVTINMDRLIGDAWERIDALGHREIACVGYVESRYATLDGACIARFESMGGGRRVRRVNVRDEFKLEDYTQDVARLFNLKPMPSAVIVWDEFLAAALMNECQRQGVRVPEDLSVVASCNQTPHIFHPPLSSPNTCSLMSRLAGEAARMARELMDKPQRQPTTLSLLGEYQWTESVRAV